MNDGLNSTVQIYSKFLTNERTINNKPRAYKKYGILLVQVVIGKTRESEGILLFSFVNTKPYEGNNKVRTIIRNIILNQANN